MRLAFRIIVEQMGYEDDSESDEEPLTTFSEDERPPNPDRQRTRDQILPPRRGGSVAARVLARIDNIFIKDSVRGPSPRALPPVEGTPRADRRGCAARRAAASRRPPRPAQ